jgi:cell division protease FtsH
MMPRSEYSEEHWLPKLISRYERLPNMLTIVPVACCESNRELIDYLVDRLLEIETMDGEEFRQIVERYTDIPEKQTQQSPAAV